MTLQQLPRGLLEIPKGTNTSCNDNSTFMNNLERTNTLLAQFVSASDNCKKLIMRQELEESYFNLTMYNMKESVKHKIEQDMWNNLFKKYISDLQNKIKSKDKLESSRAQSEISIFLDEAVGFYSKCIDTLCLVYNIHLPGNEIYQKSVMKISHNIEEVTEEDIRYMVQHCYVHMGDLSRYHNLSKQARFYYKLAVQLSPTSGHAYNQLAILESSSVAHANISANNYQHIIRTILLYEYAHTCESPFPATRINVESVLRHINEQSVSQLLTSNNSIDDQNGLSSIFIAWIHAYGHLRMVDNVQRCRQLQQRVIDWSCELVKHNGQTQTQWKELASMVALHCSLLDSYIHQTNYIENKLWVANIHQFSQDLINSISRSLVSLSYDTKALDDVLGQPGCASALVIYLTWINRYLNTDQKFQCPLKYPFGEDFVKLINLLQTKIDTSFEGRVLVPLELPELGFLTGFQPLAIPCRIYDIYNTSNNQQPMKSSADNARSCDTRIAFIVRVCRQLCIKWGALLSFNTSEQRFVVVSPPEPLQSAPPKRHVKIEAPIAVRKPVNVALASMKTNNIAIQKPPPNGMITPVSVKSAVTADGVTSSSTGTSVSTSLVTPPQSSSGVISDVKIAKCIQEHIAHDTTRSGRQDSDKMSATPLTRDESRIIAPAPGLILSSNLPPEYKSMSSLTNAIVTECVSMGPSTTESTTLDHPRPGQGSSSHKTPVTTTTATMSSYNPNREQFEKDLPPRFANKRTFSQDHIGESGTRSGSTAYYDHVGSKGGFASINYWDSGDYHSGSGLGVVTATTGGLLSDTVSMTTGNHLAKKESEMPLVPPSVPSSWLNDDSHHSLGVGNGSNLHTLAHLQQQAVAAAAGIESNINNQSLPFPSYGGQALTNQNVPQTHQINMMQHQQASPFSQFNFFTGHGNHHSTNQTLAKDSHESQLQYLLQTAAATTNAASTPWFRSQADALLSTHMNFDNVPSPQHQQHQQQSVQQQQQPHMVRMTPNFGSLGLPSPQHQVGQAVTSTNQHGFEQQQQPFQLTRSGLYDKPVFSTSSQSTQFGYGSTGSSLIAAAAQQQSMQHQHQQQQQQSMHQQHQSIQQQQQQQQQQHHIRHQNPLLNLLPGFMNENQR